MRQALRDLMESNIHFQKVNAKASNDRPRFYEGFQQIGYFDQPFYKIVENFQVWLAQKGLVINQMTWDEHFFHKKITENTTVGLQKHYVLVYFHI